jgi:hypothetical protein
LQGQHAAPDRLVWGIACLAEGLGIRGTARGGGIDANPGLQWLGAAAAQRTAFSASCRRELQRHQGQLEERDAVLRAGRGGNLSAAEAVEPLSRSPHWVWTARDSETKRLLGVRGGERPLAMAQAMWHQIAGRLAPGGVPLFLREGSAH